jgi:spore maturation protein CgeB
MRCLLLWPGRYSIKTSIKKGLEDNGVEVHDLDYESLFSNFVNSFVKKYEALPNRIKSIWKKRYIRHINEGYLNEYEKWSPELVIIYNNQFIHPEVLGSFKKRSKIVFYLGDNPLYTPTSIYNLHILFLADNIITPDSFWCEQLKRMGISNVFFDCVGFDPEIYHQLSVPEDQYNTFKSEMVYVGTAHKHNWGYKRFLFLNQFRKFDIRIYMSGNGYDRHWKTFFPGLKEKVIRHDRFDHNFNNLVYNCSRISPVEQVPSLFMGVHIRIFEILGAGCFPLCEYSHDLEQVFAGLDVPFIKDYREAEAIGNYLLSNNDFRAGLVTSMRSVVNERFSGKAVVKRMIDRLIK